VDRPSRAAVTTLTSCAVAALLASLGAALVLELWRADLAIPFDYTGDALYQLMRIKMIVRHGWYWHTPDLGAPFGLEMYDFANLEFLSSFSIKLLSYLWKDVGVLANLYFLIGFPITAASCAGAMRALGISPVLAVSGGVLFTFLPYHFFHGQAHTSLAAYFIVPWTVYLAVTRANRMLPSVLIAALSVTINAYYSFFSLITVAVTAPIDKALGGSWRQLRFKMGVCAIMGGLVLLEATPSLLYILANGKNPVFGIKDPASAETFGLKLVQLLLPTLGHRVPLLQSLGERYSQRAPLVNENQAASLGILVGCGFLLLLYWAFVPPNRGQRDDGTALHLPVSLARLNLVFVLLGTIGGFGSLMAFTVLPEIRAYSRISIYIAFASIAGLAWAVERTDWWRRAPATR
jgi:hypothetical protein